MSGLALVAGMLGVTASMALASTDSLLCGGAGYSSCSDAGYTDHAYGEQSDWSTHRYWGADPGHNCTNYVAYVETTRDGASSPGNNLGDAYQWATSASAKGIPVNGTAAVGAVAQWNANAGGASADGHVAYVEAVNADGSITVSEDSYPYSAEPDGYFDWRVIPAGSSDWPSHFIHFKDLSAGAGDTFANGSFVSYNGGVYEIVGGAPMYVSSPDAAYLPGWTTAVPVTAAQWEALSQYPANGTFLSDVQTGMVYEMAGGAPMYVSGADAPYLPGWTSATRAPHWAIVNALRPNPVNGTFLSDVQTGMVYEVAGGAPLYVSGQDAQYLPGWMSAIPAPHWEFVNYTHLRQYPVDGTYLADCQTGMVYVTAGGAPLYVSGQDAAFMPQWTSATLVPHFDFTVYQHLRQYPADGTFLSDDQTGMVYEVAGGAPLYVSSADAAFLPGWTTATLAPHFEFVNYVHLRQYPVDGTIIDNVENSGVYIVAGGAPLYVASQVGEFFPGVASALPVPGWDFTNHVDLLAVPADGTYVEGEPSGEEFVVTAGLATQAAAPPSEVPTGVDDWAIVNQLGRSE